MTIIGEYFSFLFWINLGRFHINPTSLSVVVHLDSDTTAKTRWKKNSLFSIMKLLGQEKCHIRYNETHKEKTYAGRNS